MKRLILTLLIICTPLFAQNGSLRGKITAEKGGESLAMANIQLEGVERGAASLPGGNYLITKIPPGAYTVTVDKIGYEKRSVKNVKIEAGKETKLNVTLEPKKLISPDSEKLFELMIPGMVDKELVEKLNRLKKNDPSAFKRIAKSRIKFPENPGPMFFNAPWNKKSEEISNLEIETELLGVEYPKASSSRREEIKKELKSKLDRIFEMREEVRAAELKELEDRIEELKKALAVRSENKDKIIKRRIDDLTGEGEYLEW